MDNHMDYLIKPLKAIFLYKFYTMSYLSQIYDIFLVNHDIFLAFFDRGVNIKPLYKSS